VTNPIIDEQMAYYHARAAEYDEWFTRQGRYDRGDALNRAWFAETDQLQAAMRGWMDAAPPGVSVIELACGTGIWTQELARRPDAQITALDASPEMLAINRAKVGRADVDYVQADLFQWRPERTYDRAFFSFWLSHVPPERLADFLATVARAVRPGGELFIIDSLPSGTSSARDHAAYQPETEITHVRKLNDGQAFRIYKVFYTAERLADVLGQAGFDATVATTGEYFWMARAVRR